MSTIAPPRLRWSIHGIGVEIVAQNPLLDAPLLAALGEPRSGAIATPVLRGSIEPFDAASVRRHLSPTASRVKTSDQLLELYQEDERFWLIDDNWGLCEFNLLRGHFRTWVLPEPRIDIGRFVEKAVLWPLAQLMRPRGLCLIPAAAIIRDGWGVLLLSGLNLEPELTALVHAGYRLVGQSWTALREQNGRVMLLSMPGTVQREGETIDLTSQYPGSVCEQAECSAAMILTPGRRPLSHLQTITPSNAPGAMRRAWPMVELHPLRRAGHMSSRIAARCPVHELTLSRNPADLLTMLDQARYTRTQRPIERVA